MPLTKHFSGYSKFIASAFIIAAIASGSLAQANKSRQQTKRAPAAKAINIPAPIDELGFTPGDDRKLASWQQIATYFSCLTAQAIA